MKRQVKRSTARGPRPIQLLTLEALDISASAIKGIRSMSPELRSIIVRLSEHLEYHTDLIVKAFRSAIPEYEAIRDPALEAEIFDMCLTAHRLWFKALTTCQLPTASDLKPIEEYARRRVHQGVSLSALQHAYRVGIPMMWKVLLENVRHDKSVFEEMMFIVSPYLMYYENLVGHAISQAYSQESLKSNRWRDRVQHELCGIIFTSSDDNRGFHDRSLALGMDTSLHHVAVAIKTSREATSTLAQHNELEQVLQPALKAFGANPNSTLRTSRPGHLILWLQQPKSDSYAAFESALQACATKLIKSYKGIEAVGIGLPGIDARGWRRSAEGACDVIELGRRVWPKGSVYKYSDVAVEHALMESGTLTELFAELLHRFDAEPPLLETFEAYCEHAHLRKAAAAALDIHPNTLDYRLGRIEKIVGGKLSDPQWLTRLHLMLRLRKLRALP